MNEKVIKSFIKQNQEDGLRVFVAGGNRPGNDETYVKEAYNLGRQIIKMDFKLDFGVGNSGIMGAVACGIMDSWKGKQTGEKSPISGVTTKEYLDLYPTDDALICSLSELIVTNTLEERKRKLLNADFVVFAPGGVGTLDELAYDMVAMQDGFLPIKPFIIYNVKGYFHHLLEYLKEISSKGFADPVPFIVVDNSNELEIVFRLLKLRYKKGETTKEVYANARQLIYELPYFIKKKVDNSVFIENIIDNMDQINANGSAEQRQGLANEIEQAYLEKEIERMYERLAKSGHDTGIVSEKLEKLKERKEHKSGF